MRELCPIASYTCMQNRETFGWLVILLQLASVIEIAKERGRRLNSK